MRLVYRKTKLSKIVYIAWNRGNFGGQETDEFNNKVEYTPEIGIKKREHTEY